MVRLADLKNLAPQSMLIKCAGVRETWILHTGHYVKSLEPKKDGQAGGCWFSCLINSTQLGSFHDGANISSTGTSWMSQLFHYSSEQYRPELPPEEHLKITSPVAVQHWSEAADHSSRMDKLEKEHASEKQDAPHSSE